MRDPECAVFLQWALLRMRGRYRGYRKVRRQVCRRIRSRASTLGFSAMSEYRDYLERTAQEWDVLRDLTRITISRFCRDRPVFERLAEDVFLDLAQGLHEGQGLQVWSAGCASGEEPYTLALVLGHQVQPFVPGLSFSVLGTDSDETMLARACAATYRWSSVRELPGPWIEQAFKSSHGLYWLRSSFKQTVEFRKQDICTQLPEQDFHAILCRNLVFTYFEEASQLEILERLWSKLHPGGALVLGKHERLPEDARGFEPWDEGLRIYRKTPRESRR